MAELWSLNQGTEPDDSKQYAEFWMGSHIGDPSHLHDSVDKMSLQDWIASHPEAIGKLPETLQTWKNTLPYLFKILSVGSALSIQAHPDAKLALELRASRPEAYPDNKPKPEMALALNDFEALCGFRTMENITTMVQQVPELSEILESGQTDQSVMGSGQIALKAMFQRLMTCEPKRAAQAVEKLFCRLTEEKKQRNLTAEESWALRLAQHYPEDIGVFCVFLLNLIHLQPGEAVALGANEPHAYLQGDIVEVMAASDNVVRAGLTSKFRDVDVLCNMLTYNQGYPEIMKGEEIQEGVLVYRPLFPEFELHSITIKPQCSIKLKAMLGPAIILVLSGNCSFHAEKVTVKNAGLVSEVKGSKGTVVFVSTQTVLQLEALEEKVCMFMAKCNEKYF